MMSSLLLIFSKCARLGPQISCLVLMAAASELYSLSFRPASSILTGVIATSCRPLMLLNCIRRPNPSMMRSCSTLFV